MASDDASANALAMGILGVVALIMIAVGVIGGGDEAPKPVEDSPASYQPNQIKNLYNTPEARETRETIRRLESQYGVEPYKEDW